jgi:small subunit ribosomal protein S9
MVEEKKQKYIEAIGRRKEAVARVRFYFDKPNILINDQPLEVYFPIKENQEKVLAPLKLTNMENKYLIKVKVRGGGTTGQAEAIRLGISRCLLKINENLRKILKEAGFLTRDARIVERKKFGLKKARRAPQWQKR